MKIELHPAKGYAFVDKSKVAGREIVAAVVLVSGKRFIDICKQGKGDGLSYRFLYNILAGKVPLSERAEDILRKAVGERGWRYALGRSDRLPCKLTGPAPRRRMRVKHQNGQE